MRLALILSLTAAPLAVVGALALRGSVGLSAWLAGSFASCAIAVWTMRTPLARRLVLAGASVLFALLLADVLLRRSSVRRESIAAHTVREEYRYRADSPIGYAPAPSQTVRQRKEDPSGRLVYDITYTIDRFGYRDTPGRPSAGLPCVLLFGGSFTYGAGVEDDETLPAALQRLLGDDARVVNLGFHGYGPHQMLRSLEVDLVASAVDGPVAAVVYYAIPDHVRRAAGTTSWGRKGPRYEPGSDGVPVFAGLFEPRPDQLDDGGLVGALAEQFGPRDGPEELRIFLAIVTHARDIVRERYDAPFRVLFWDDDSALSKGAVAGLARAGIEVIRVTEAIAIDDPQWRIPGDGHPAVGAHTALADLLAERLRIER